VFIDSDERKRRQNMKNKKATIVIRLVEESFEKTNAEIKKEIIEALSEETPCIPWFKKLEKITITEE
jgi:hypothetical protein